MAYNKKTNMYEGYIYLIKNLINGKKYVGQTIQTINARMSQHIRKQKKIKGAIDAAIKKYGVDSFVVEELEKIECKTKDELVAKLNDAEIYYIDKLGTMFNKNGYNIEPGGSGGTYIRRQIDIFDFKGSFVETLDSGIDVAYKYDVDAHSVYRTCSGEITHPQNCDYVFRYHGDDFWKYNPYQTPSQYDIYQFTIDGDFLSHFYNIRQAALSLGVNNVSVAITNIHRALNPTNNSLRSAYGYLWSTGNHISIDFKHYKNKKPVNQYDINGELLRSFESLSDAARFYGKQAASGGNIKKSCEGITIYPVWGYIWRYFGDSFDKYPVNSIYPKSRKSVDKYSLDGEYLSSYDTVSSAVISTGYDIEYSSHITKCCNGKSNNALGYIWRWKGDPIGEIKKPKNYRKLNCYSKDNCYITTYESGGDAARNVFPERSDVHGISNVIRTCATGGTKSAYGYKWYYADDPDQPDKTRIVGTAAQIKGDING